MDEQNPTSYKPPVRWHTCTNPMCGVMWTGFADASCWACGAAGSPSWQPKIGSQSGFTPADWD